METGTGLAKIAEKLRAYALSEGGDTAPVTLVATGALTNVALLLRNYEQTMKKCIKEIVIMGGAMGVEIEVRLEFNILCDPEAAKIVFDSDFKVVMVPLEVTHTAIASKTVIQKILHLNHNEGDSERNPCSVK